jgi:hypothetical protein
MYQLCNKLIEETNNLSKRLKIIIRQNLDTVSYVLPAVALLEVSTLGKSRANSAIVLVISSSLSESEKSSSPKSISS